MELLQAWMGAHIPSAWGPVAGFAAIVVYQHLKVHFPTFFAKFPHVVPLPAPTAQPMPAIPVTVVSPNHPALDALLKLLGNRAIPVLADEVKSRFAEPEPATVASSSAN